MRRQAREPIDAIEGAASRIRATAREFSEEIRAGRPAVPISRALLDIRDLCGEVLQDCRHLDSSRQVDFSFLGDPVGRWDRSRLYQAISNLVTNAIRHGAGPVRMTAKGFGGQVDVVVHNRGVVIPAARLLTIFDPFERRQEQGAGIGLGLYIVRGIAQAHGGTVLAESEEYSGTTFTLRLPRAA